MDMPTIGIQFEIPTWNQVYEMLVELAMKIKYANYAADIIIGIARGGLIPSRILVDLLEVPEIAIIQTAFYRDIKETMENPILKQPLVTPLEGKKVLIVDDISDSGQTLWLVKKYIQESRATDVKMATLYVKLQSALIPDFYAKDTTSWVVFPWEIKETISKTTKEKKGNRAKNREIQRLTNAGLPKQLTKKICEI